MGVGQSDLVISPPLDVPFVSHTAQLPWVLVLGQHRLSVYPVPYLHLIPSVLSRHPRILPVACQLSSQTLAWNLKSTGLSRMMWPNQLSLFLDGYFFSIPQ